MYLSIYIRRVYCLPVSVVASPVMFIQPASMHVRRHDVLDVVSHRMGAYSSDFSGYKCGRSKIHSHVQIRMLINRYIDS